MPRLLCEEAPTIGLNEISLLQLPTNLRAPAYVSANTVRSLGENSDLTEQEATTLKRKAILWILKRAIAKASFYRWRVAILDSVVMEVDDNEYRTSEPSLAVSANILFAKV